MTTVPFVVPTPTPPPSMRRRVAVVDMAVAADSPAGSCVLMEVEALAAHFDVTVFSAQFDAPSLPGVQWVRIPVLRQPVLLRYLSFHGAVWLAHLAWRLRGGRASCVQATQGQLPAADICYAHFCHRAYLRQQWALSSDRGARRVARWAVHAFNAWAEIRALRRARHVVVPSLGLARELAAHHPACADKIQVLANPVAVARYRRPAVFDRSGERACLGCSDAHIVLVFMALGDFARKGLGLLLHALALLAEDERAPLRLIVIGGRPGEIEDFAAEAQHLALAGVVRFVGHQSDVRPMLWLGDAYAFPSAYEIFSLAVLQAAAAGLPVLACDGVYGSEEFVVDGVNGWSIARTHDALAGWMRRVLAERDRLPAMGAAAAASVSRYDVSAFQAKWVELITSAVAAGPASPHSGASGASRC